NVIAGQALAPRPATVPFNSTSFSSFSSSSISIFFARTELSACFAPSTSTVWPTASAENATVLPWLLISVEPLVLTVVVPTTSVEPEIDAILPLNSTSGASGGSLTSSSSTWTFDSLTNPVSCVPLTSTFSPFLSALNGSTALLLPVICVVPSPLKSVLPR